MLLILSTRKISCRLLLLHFRWASLWFFDSLARTHKRWSPETSLKKSSANLFDYNITNFKTRLWARGYPNNLIEKNISEVKFTELKSALQQNEKVRNKNYSTFHHNVPRPAWPNLRNILISKWHLIQNQPLLREIFKMPPLISYKKGKS